MTDDQKAMLRLLAQREEGYEDMAALMGISVEEVRSRVKEALSEVEQAEGAAQEPTAPPPAPTSSTPAEPEPPLPPAPKPPEPKTAEAPPAPPTAASPRPAGKKAQAPRAAPGRRLLPSSGLKLPKDRGALIGLAAGAGAVLVMAIVLIVGGSGGGSSSTASSTEGGATPATAEDRNLTQAILAPVDGSEASGVALFGRFKKKVLLQVTAKGLDPSQSGESYAVWLSHSGKAMVPVGTARVPSSGDLAARFEIPTAVLLLIARGSFNEIDVTRTSDATLSAAIAAARKNKTESAYTGTDAMRGKITGPFVGAASKK
jgi:outer membrane biosynthesis protein TonB